LSRQTKRTNHEKRRPELRLGFFCGQWKSDRLIRYMMRNPRRTDVNPLPDFWRRNNSGNIFLFK
jgi:hypothetical protein